jgi:hypothetical protein
MEIFLDVRAAFKTAATVSERDAIRGYVSPCMLVIDEMQERGETAFEDRLLTYIIEVRYAEMRDTVLISNQLVDEFARQVERKYRNGFINAVSVGWDTLEMAPSDNPVTLRYDCPS